jgi:hypothetical protein
VKIVVGFGCHAVGAHAHVVLGARPVGDIGCGAVGVRVAFYDLLNTAVGADRHRPDRWDRYATAALHHVIDSCTAVEANDFSRLDELPPSPD